MNKQEQLLMLGLWWSALVGGTGGALAGVLTDIHLEAGGGFFYNWLPGFFYTVSVSLIIFVLSLGTAPRAKWLKWGLIVIGGFLLGASVGWLAGFASHSSPDRIVWMGINAVWGTSCGMFLVTAGITWRTWRK